MSEVDGVHEHGPRSAEDEARDYLDLIKGVCNDTAAREISDTLWQTVESGNPLIILGLAEMGQKYKETVRNLDMDAANEVLNTQLDALKWGIEIGRQGVFGLEVELQQ